MLWCLVINGFDRWRDICGLSCDRGRVLKIHDGFGKIMEIKDGFMY